MTDFTIQIKLDLEKDAWNYRSAFNKNTHSNKWKEQVGQTTIINLQQLQGMRQKDAYPFLCDYLVSFWEEHKEEANKKIVHMQNFFDIHKDDIFTKMITLTKHPIYRNSFTIFLTSLNR